MVNEEGEKVRVRETREEDIRIEYSWSGPKLSDRTRSTAQQYPA